jgi:hypothetical protein
MPELPYLGYSCLPEYELPGAEPPVQHHGFMRMLSGGAGSQPSRRHD